MLDVTREDIQNGPLARVLVLLAAPLIAQNVVHVANQLVDIFWVGRLGGLEVAAIGLTWPVVALVSAIPVGTFVGTQVLVSQRVGADDLSGARRAAFAGMILAALAGVAIALAGWFGSGPVVSLLDAEPALAGLAASYLAIVLLGFPAVAASDTLEAGFIGWGDSRAALAINLAMVGVNVVLDPFLILGLGPFPALGVEGAALATVAGYVAGFLAAFSLFVVGRDEFRLTRNAARLDLDDWREIVDIGLPNTGQRIASQSVRVVIVGVVVALGGTAGVAAYTIGGRIATVAFIPAWGLQQAAQSVVGQNLGADQPARAGRATWVGVAIAFVGLTVVGVVQWFVPGAIAHVIVPDLAGEAFALTVDYLRILALGYGAIGATYLFLAGFNGARRTRTSMVVTLLQYWGVRLPIAVIGGFVLAFGVHAAFWAVTLSNVAAAVGTGGYYRYVTADGMLDRAASEAVGASDD